MSAAGAAGRRAHRRPMLLVALVAVIAGSTAYLLGAWPGLESESVDLRFSLVSAKRPHDILIVAVDNKTLNALQSRWPFPRSVDARAVDELHADHARTIVFDVQFTEPTAPKEDLALYGAIARAGGVVLATSEIGPGGRSNVLGGDANLAAAHARAAASSVRPNSSGVIQKYPYSIGGLKALAVATAEEATGHPLSQAAFDRGSAWIDFRGPVGTIPTVSFSDLVQGRVNPSQIAGKIVVIGATSTVLQDIHATSTTSSHGMPGPEVQANAILTALDGNPLREAPGWAALLAILLCGIATPLCCLRMRATRAFAFGLLLAAGYALVAQAAFAANLILVVTYPLAAAAFGALGALIVSYAIESWERQLAERYGATLEATVRERTAELRESATELRKSAAELRGTQLEAIHRLARAAELRDEDTGLHIERIGRICELLALRAGMSRPDAERLGIASALHDVGKIGVPDRILLKPGSLDPVEWEIMKAHTTTGAALLSGSNSALIQVAETVARSHHEHWDGSGYPDGLRGTEIPLVGRICAICDVFDALSSRRPYKESWPFDRVLEEIVRTRGTHFDPELVDAFLTLVPELERAHAQATSQTSQALVLAGNGM
jgi:HD-GYP domain-containing protein (c-di-GMP phosphodiesterase class II)/CHASE2 domain-containing sensor protein